MAKVKFGELASDVRGSIDGVTYSRNRNGAYVRSRVSPVNPNTPDQSQARFDFGSIATNYRGLSDGERSGWQTLGQSMIRTDSLGQSYNLTGLQAYMSVNRIRQLFGQTETPTAPTLPVIPNFTTLTGTFDGGTPELSIAFTPTPLTGYRLLIEATRPVSAGINFFARSAYKLIVGTTAAPTSPRAFESEYATAYGGLDLTQYVGSRVNFRITMVDGTTYVPGNPVILTGVLA